MNKQTLTGSYELLTKSYKLYSVNFWDYLILGILMVVPSALVQLSPAKYLDQSLPIASFELMLLIVYFTLPSISVIAITALTHYAVLGQKENAVNLLESSFRKLFAWWWISILTGFWIFGGFLLLIIPGIILSIRLSLGIYVLVAENQRGLSAALRSRNLVKGYTVETLIRLLIPTILAAIFVLLYTALRHLAPITAEAIFFAFNVLFAPFLLVYVYFIYSSLASISRS